MNAWYVSVVIQVLVGMIVKAEVKQGWYVELRSSFWVKESYVMSAKFADFLIHRTISL